ncbi:MAG TPA: MoaD/ThiS family protein [Gemmatimonadaceae bacterium]|jgi:molybdopterin converting factor subunit 1|nr:MoaD/ThiS family protein [Gemmatimonadaceae bacterium]
MTVTVRLFASYAESLGRSELSLDLGASATVADVVNAIAAMPGASRLPPAPLVAVNCSYAVTTTNLSDGDEIAFIPPVAGG